MYLALFHIDSLIEKNDSEMEVKKNKNTSTKTHFIRFISKNIS